jgi:deoxyuridine 5'-triphosphate nucleotidohydrolase
MTNYDNYFKNIDTIEKAYILGLVYKNNNYIMALINNKTVIDILSNFSFNIDKTYTINITNINFLNDIQKSINNFPSFSNDLKIAFVRGLYESNYNQGIDINDTINEIIEIIKKDFIINFDIIDNMIIIKNTKKFINKIYKNNDITILAPKTKNKLLYDINSKPSIKVFKSNENAVIPSKAFEEDAGYDLTIISKIKDFNSKTTLYDTGIKIEVDEGYYTEIVPRSSISKFGYILANNIGIIDNHYRGNLMIALTKIADDAPEISLPFKCCQLIIRKQIDADLYEVIDNSLSSTVRNEGGFGSTS